MPNVTLKLPDNILANAKRVAEREFRSLSQHVAYLIEQDSNARNAKQTAPRRRSRKEAA